jgi:hypothetical protein
MGRNVTSTGALKAVGTLEVTGMCTFSNASISAAAILGGVGTNGLSVDASDALPLSASNVSVLTNTRAVAPAALALWAKKIDGTNDDIGYGVAVDASGNVYVTGYYSIVGITVDSIAGVTLDAPINGGMAAYIVKYNTSGTAQWAKKIDGTGSDEGQGVAVDASGNVYVTGTYRISSITVDGITLDAPINAGVAAYIIKYNTSGTALWAKKIDGAGTDYGLGVAVDASGNVYVTGHYQSAAITVDGITLAAALNGGFATYIIKYNTSGTALWAKKIDGMGNEYGNGVAVDASGNVYVTGYYTNAAITVDAGVTLDAPLNGGAAAYIIKYNTSGTALWAKKIDGTGNEYGNGVAVDASGNVYVTGYYGAASITVDSVAGVTLDATLGGNAAYIIKYNTSGTAQWAKKIDGTGDDRGNGVAVDAFGNVYVTGRYNTAAITVDSLTLATPLGLSAAYIIKYNTSGTAQWAKKIDGTGNDLGMGVAVDVSGNVYVTGYYGTAAITVDALTLDATLGAAAAFIVKYSSSDAVVTPYTLVSNPASSDYKFLVNSSPYPATVTVRDATNTTTINTLTIGSGGYEAVTWANAASMSDAIACTGLDVSGGKTIIDRQGGITGYNSNAIWSTAGDVVCRSITTTQPALLTVDDSDSLTLSTGHNVSVLKNSNPSASSALAMWAKKIDGAGNDEGQGVAVDAFGNVYVIGYYGTAGITVDAVAGVTLDAPLNGTMAAYIVKYNTYGTALWAKKIDGTSNDYGYGVAVDASGNVYVTGFYSAVAITVDALTLDVPLGGSAAFIVKYNTSGTALWAKKIDGTGSDVGQVVAVDVSGNVYVTGYYSDASITVDALTLDAPVGPIRYAAFIVKFNTFGVALWIKAIDGISYDQGYGISVDALGNVYTTGYYSNAITVDVVAGVTLVAPLEATGGSIRSAAYIIKYNTFGTALWAKNIDGTGNDVARGVAVDVSGNIYVTGYYSTAGITVDAVTLAAPLNGGQAAFIIKYNASMTALWAKKIDSTGSDLAMGVAVDASGNVYVTGYYATGAITVDAGAGITLDAPLGGNAAYIIKYNTVGTALWAKKIDGTGHDGGMGVAVDASGNVYVTGYYSTAGITVDAFAGVTLAAPLGGTTASYIIKYQQGDPAYTLISNPSTSNGFYKLLVNSSASPATVIVRNASNSTTLNNITIPSKAVKALTWYGTEFFAI